MSEKYIPASEVEKLRDGIRDLEIIVDGYGPDNLTMQSYERSARETIAALRALLASAVELPEPEMGARELARKVEDWILGYGPDLRSVIAPYLLGARPVPDDKLREAAWGVCNSWNSGRQGLFEAVQKLDRALRKEGV